jgi:hypothetical protein
VSRKGNCWDNAPMESFFHSLKHRLTKLGKTSFVWRESVVTRKRPDRLGHNLRSAHQLGDRVATAGNPLNRQLRVHSRRAIRLAAGKVDFADLGGQRGLPLLPGAGRPAPGCVVPAGGNAQGVTQRTHRMLPALAFDKGVLHLDAFAK